MTTTASNLCASCGKQLSPYWRDKCAHCGAPMAVARPVPPIKQATFRGVSEADCLRQAEADAARARATGYEVAGQSWADDGGVRVLFVDYRWTGQLPATPATTSTGILTWPLVAAIGGIVLGLGAFLPWLTASTGFASASRSGIDGGGDGIFFLAGGALIAVLALAGGATARFRVPIMLLGLLGLAGAAIEYQHIQGRLAGLDTVVGGIGIGLYAVGLGAALALVAGKQMGDLQTRSA